MLMFSPTFPQNLIDKHPPTLVNSDTEYTEHLGEFGVSRRPGLEATEQIGQLKKESNDCREQLSKREQERLQGS